MNSHGPVTDVSSLDLRCGKDASTAYAPSILSVAAGQTLGFTVDPSIQHPGPTLAYLARVPPGKTAADWDAAGAVWFKIFEQGPTALNSNGGVWPATGTLWTNQPNPTQPLSPPSTPPNPLSLPLASPRPLFPYAR